MTKTVEEEDDDLSDDKQPSSYIAMYEKAVMGVLYTLNTEKHRYNVISNFLFKINLHLLTNIVRNIFFYNFLR